MWNENVGAGSVLKVKNRQRVGGEGGKLGAEIRLSVVNSKPRKMRESIDVKKVIFCIPTSARFAETGSNGCGPGV